MHQDYVNCSNNFYNTFILKWRHFIIFLQFNPKIGPYCFLYHSITVVLDFCRHEFSQSKGCVAHSFQALSVRGQFYIFTHIIEMIQFLPKWNSTTFYISNNINTNLVAIRTMLIHILTGLFFRQLGRLEYCK